MSANSRFQNFTMTLPEKGPMSVPDFWDFAANETTEIDLTQLIENGWLDFISGVYIDNTANPGNLLVECNGTNQRFPFPAYAAGYIPLFLPNPPKIKVTSDAAGSVRFQWYNVPVFPIVLPGPNTPDESIDIIAVGGNPVTDSLPVSQPIGGAYTDHSIANLSGASETLMAANPNRKVLIVQNVASNPMAINLFGNAAAINTAGSITLPAGASIVLDNYPSTSAITIIGTANDDVTAMEG